MSQVLQYLSAGVAILGFVLSLVRDGWIGDDAARLLIPWLPSTNQLLVVVAATGWVAFMILRFYPLPRWVTCEPFETDPSWIPLRAIQHGGVFWHSHYSLPIGSPLPSADSLGYDPSPHLAQYLHVSGPECPKEATDKFGYDTRCFIPLTIQEKVRPRAQGTEPLRVLRLRCPSGHFKCKIRRHTAAELRHEARRIAISSWDDELRGDSDAAERFVEVLKRR